MATTTFDGTSTPYPITAGSTVTVNDSDTLILLGTIDNQGTIFEDSKGDYTEISVGGTAATLTGGGDVVLSQSAAASSYNQNFINAADDDDDDDPSASTQTLYNVDNTISGSGELLSLALDNEVAGVIDANGATGNGLEFYTNGIANAGLIEATGVGGLFVDSTIDQSAGGTLLATGAGVLAEIYVADIIGGTLATAGGGMIGLLNGTLDGSTAPIDITAGSTVEALDSFGVTLLGTIHNAGTLDVLGGSALSLSSPMVTLTGGGMVAFDGRIDNTDSTIANVLVNVDNTIVGSGFVSLTAAGSGLTNDASGVIDATGDLTIRLAGGAVRNAGLIESTNSNMLAIDDATIDNTGGTLLANSGTITFDTVTLYGGVGSQISASSGGAYIFYNTDTLGSNSTGVTIVGGAPFLVDGTVYIASDTASNSGVIELGDPDDYISNTTYRLILNAATTTLDGGGAIQFVPKDTIFASNDDEIVGSTATPATLINVDNTISGSGAVGSAANPVALVNDAEGVVNASGSRPLTIDAATGSVRNAGLMESTLGGGLIVNSATLDNTGGTLLTAGNIYQGYGGTIALNGVDVIGGTLMTNIFPSDTGPTQRGVFDFASGGGTLDGRTQTITIETLSQLMVESGSTLDLLGTIAWQGADLQVSGTASNAGTVIGTGQIAGDLTNTGAVIAAGGALDITGTVSGAGSMAIATGGRFELGAASAEAVDFRGITNGLLILDTPTTYGGALTNMVDGDLLQLDSLDVASTQVIDGTTLAVTLTDSTVQDFSLANLAYGARFTVQSAGPSGSTLAVECFAEGTRIRTCRGEVAVEALQVGDTVPTCVSGAAQRVVWIGRRRVDCQRHPEPRRVQPVRISAHAFGPAYPARDLFLSPDHAIYVEDVLIPVRYLVNRHSIVQIDVDTVIYYHVELARHDVLWAEGLPVESYLDSGNRSQFANGGVGTTMHSDLLALWEAYGCAPLVVSGPALVAARATLDAQLPERAAA